MAEQVNNDTTATTASAAFKKGDFKNMEMFKKAKHHADSVHNVIIQLQKDSLVLAKDVEILKSENATLLAKVDQLEAAKDSLTIQLQQAKANQSPVAALTSPSGCAVLIVLILAIMVIALKKGFSFSKNGTVVAIGENKKEEQK
ncbi:hypothetical protein [uncultured Fibrobacter sp.]|uniref:hypothetical protein n=1 Tax=uncultured Fibrobacter sp. TaxID=261512 RepID=UPI0025E2070C|nr:hypothetical protein [uncultured Fibrobacter sp.]